MSTMLITIYITTLRQRPVLRTTSLQNIIYFPPFKKNEFELGPCLLEVRNFYFLSSSSQPLSLHRNVNNKQQILFRETSDSRRRVLTQLLKIILPVRKPVLQSACSEKKAYTVTDWITMRAYKTTDAVTGGPNVMSTTIVRFQHLVYAAITGSISSDV